MRIDPLRGGEVRCRFDAVYDQRETFLGIVDHGEVAHQGFEFLSERHGANTLASTAGAGKSDGGLPPTGMRNIRTSL